MPPVSILSKYQCVTHEVLGSVVESALFCLCLPLCACVRVCVCVCVCGGGGDGGGGACVLICVFK